MADRPSDIKLPEGWTWERVEQHRAKWSISDDMVPVALVPGACVAWGTINSVRLCHLEDLIGAYLAAKTADDANRLAVEVESYADEIGYEDHARLMAIHTTSERKFAMWEETEREFAARNAHVAEPFRQLLNDFSRGVERAGGDDVIFEDEERPS